MLVIINCYMQSLKLNITYLPLLHIRNISLRIIYLCFVTNYYCYGLKVITHALGVIQLWFKI